MPQRNLVYTAARLNGYSRGYEHAEIAVYRRYPDGEGYEREPLLTLTWQTHDGGRPGWYGFRIVVEAREVPRLADAAGLARRLFGQDGGDLSVEQVLERLERVAAEAVYDPRLNRRVPREELVDPTWALWTDDYAALGERQVRATALAADAESARVGIARALAERAARDIGPAQAYAEYLARWMAAGKPVRQIEPPFNPPPPARELLRLAAAG